VERSRDFRAAGGVGGQVPPAREEQFEVGGMARGCRKGFGGIENG